MGHERILIWWETINPTVVLLLLLLPYEVNYLIVSKGDHGGMFESWHNRTLNAARRPVWTCICKNSKTVLCCTAVGYIVVLYPLQLMASTSSSVRVFKIVEQVSKYEGVEY